MPDHLLRFGQDMHELERLASYKANEDGRKLLYRLLKMPTRHPVEHASAAFACLNKTFNHILPNTTPIFHDTVIHAARWRHAG